MYAYLPPDPANLLLARSFHGENMSTSNCNLSVLSGRLDAMIYLSRLAHTVQLLLAGDTRYSTRCLYSDTT